MHFVDTRAGDLDAVLALSSKEYDKLPGPDRVDEEITGLDQAGNPRIVMRAERVAVVYLAIDHAWKNPGMRWGMIERTYKEMRRRLAEKGYTAAYCFFADGVPNGYVRRLVNEMGAHRVMDRCIRFSAEVG